MLLLFANGRVEPAHIETSIAFIAPKVVHADNRVKSAAHNAGLIVRAIGIRKTGQMTEFMSEQNNIADHVFLKVCIAMNNIC